MNEAKIAKEIGGLIILCNQLRSSWTKEEWNVHGKEYLTEIVEAVNLIENEIN